jgi:hypothetical protein
MVCVTVDLLEPTPAWFVSRRLRRILRIQGCEKGLHEEGYRHYCDRYDLIIKGVSNVYGWTDHVA